MVITDLYEHLIDDKNRLSIASEIRNAMDPEIDGSAFYLVPEFQFLQLVPEKMFRAVASRNPMGLFQSPEAAKACRYLFANSTRLEPDKQGRVIIPERFMASSKNPIMANMARLERQVTLVGANTHVEIWNTQKFISEMQVLTSAPASLSRDLQAMFGAVNAAPTPAASGA